MNDSPVVFLDSGIGGVPYLQWVRRRRPDLSLLYVADTANFPYGEVPERVLRPAIAEAAAAIFARVRPKILALVCNTASVASLEDLRAIAPCPVVGTVPAVKTAVEVSADGPIGVLATQGTVDSPYLDRLVRSYAPNREVVRVAAGDIVRYVENRWLDEGDTGAAEVLAPALEALGRSKVVSVVIGCTHFLHVFKSIRDGLGSGVSLVDSRDGVGRRILDLLGSDSGDGGACRFFVTRTKPGDRRYRQFARRFNLDWCGEI